MNFIITKDILNLIIHECEVFNEKTNYFVNSEDILFTLLNTGCILNDWNEGEANDPFWDKELNEHSVIVFINNLCEKLIS